MKIKRKDDDTCIIRIQKHTREQLKMICKKEGRLLGAYADELILKAVQKRRSSREKI